MPKQNANLVSWHFSFTKESLRLMIYQKTITSNRVYLYQVKDFPHQSLEHVSMERVF
jgi:hypothetical protein